MTPEDYPDLLVDAAALWEVSSSEGFDELIRTATTALVDGVDTPSLRMLAGETSPESYWALQPIVQEMLSELGRHYPRGEAAQVAAMRAMCRRLQNGLINEQRLTSWALHTIGWTGTTEARELLELEGAYSEVEALGLDVELLNRETRHEAERLLGLTM